MKTYCICLPEYPDQIRKARAHFTASGLTNVEFFWGINAQVAGLATSHKYELDNPGGGWRIGEKATGCWLSHYMLWNALTQLPDELFFILETDAQFHPGFAVNFAQALKDVPSDFDYLAPGHCCLKGQPTKRVTGNVYESKHMMCTHAYVVKRKALPTLLSMRKVWAPIDIQLKLECFPKLRTYAVVPRIVSQFNTVLGE